MLQDVRGLEVIKTPMMEQKQKKKQLVGAKLIFKRNDPPNLPIMHKGFFLWALKKYLKHY